MAESLILVIEPDYSLQSTLKDILEEAGYVVMCSDGSEQGLDAFQGLSSTISVILMNVDRPDMSYVEVIRQAVGEGFHAPIICYSVEDNLELALNSMRAGAVDYFHYPVDPNALLHSVRRALEDISMTHKMREIVTAQLAGEERSQAEIRLKIATEVMRKRQAEGQVMSKKELSALLGIYDHIQANFSAHFKAQLDETGIPYSSTAPKENVWVIEDEPIHRENLSLLLSQDYTIHLSEDIASAQEDLKHFEQVDIVLCDIMLPDGCGVDMIEMIKAKHPFAEIIMITGYEITELAIESFQRGAYDYINKPFRRSDIMFTIAKALHHKYVKQALEELDYNGAQPTLSKKVRGEMAKVAFQQKMTKGELFTVKDLCCFFPELGESSVNKETVITQQDVDDGIVLYVELSLGGD